MRRFYFAFGSNLDESQMQRRCPGAEFISIATLRDHELAFTGTSKTWAGAVATVRPNAGSIVPGVVYLLAPSDWPPLDRYEGVPHLYERVAVDIHPPGARPLRSLAYRRTEDLPDAQPYWSYLDTIVQAYETFGFDKEPVHAALRRAARNRAFHSASWGAEPEETGRTIGETQVGADDDDGADPAKRFYIRAEGLFGAPDLPPRARSRGRGAR